MKPFAYSRAGDAPTALGLISQPHTKFLAGGTNLVDLMRENIEGTDYFICNELRGVYGGVNDSTTWTASCSEMLSYTVRVASAGSLRVEPMVQHFDGVSPQTIPGEDPLRVLPPQRLPPQPR